MKVSVSLLPADRAITSTIDVAVVIDVLRATSVISAALSAGAAKVITCREVSEATQLAESIWPRPLLCGERGCMPIDGFDLGNSPAEYQTDRVRGKTLVLTTSNGTAAIEATRKARRVITASFLNFSAVIESLRDAERVHLVCAGTDGAVTAEDVLLAGALTVQCAIDHSASVLGDESVLARELWFSWFGSESFPDPNALSERLRETRGGRNLVHVGYRQDVNQCAALDSLAGVPQRVSENPTIFALQATAGEG